jgi:DNA (cytosine-5)-methyltransferase 1
VKLTVGSLFSGIGGMDLGFCNAGFKTIWFCEKDRSCQRLHNKFPGVPIYSDVKDLLKTRLLGNNPIPVPDVIIGGDPCPARSIAKGNHESRHPDLSGYYLAVAARLAPRWVVRENVPSPNVNEFALALEACGYAVVVIWANASQFVPQNRERAFVVGCTSKTAIRMFHVQATNPSSRKALSKVQHAVLGCLMSQEGGNVRNANFVWKSGKGLRRLLAEEYEYGFGFPIGWTSGFSDAVRKRMCGNAVVPAVAEAIAIEIKKASSKIKSWSVLDTDAGIQRVLARKLVI